MGAVHFATLMPTCQSETFQNCLLVDYSNIVCYNHSTGSQIISIIGDPRSASGGIWNLERADLLTDLSLATGYGAFFADRSALKLTGDEALGRPREMDACPGCAFDAPSACFAHWTAPGGERAHVLPGGRPFACLTLVSEGAPAGRLLLGPLDPRAAEDPRQARALLSVMDALAARMEGLGLLKRRNDLFARLSRHIFAHLTDELTGARCTAHCTRPRARWPTP